MLCKLHFKYFRFSSMQYHFYLNYISFSNTSIYIMHIFLPQDPCCGIQSSQKLFLTCQSWDWKSKIICQSYKILPVLQNMSNFQMCLHYLHIGMLLQFAMTLEYCDVFKPVFRSMLQKFCMTNLYWNVLI